MLKSDLGIISLAFICLEMVDRQPLLAPTFKVTVMSPLKDRVAVGLGPV